VRVLYLSHAYTTHDRRFLTKLARSRHEIFFLPLHDDGIAYEQRPLPAGVQAVPWAPDTGPITPQTCLARMPALERVLEEVRPDVVQAGPIPTCAFMVAMAGFRPLLAASWGSDMLVQVRDDPTARWAAEYALERSDAYLVDSDAVRTAVKALSAAGDESFVQFPWGIELERFPRQPPRSPDDGIVVLSTRSWAPIYGIETVVEAFALAHRQEPRLRLVLAGDGPSAPQVAAVIARHGIEDLVRRPGRIPEEQLGAQFAAADVYLSCTLSDGTSISLLEAMAYGLPVVATDAFGNKEWVTPGQGGWLAPAGDAAAFADALLHAARLGPEPRARMAAYNRAVVEARADWETNSDRLLAALERLAQVPGRTARVG
jgi:glycosyltransferase involved in cell wall biosynthesis